MTHRPGTATPFSRANADTLIAAFQDMKRSRADDPRWPWPSLNTLFGSMGPGHLIVLGGFTGNGKTALMLNVASALLDAGVPWAYAGLEMSPGILAECLGLLRCGLSRRALVDGLSSRDQAHLETAFVTLTDSWHRWHFLPDSSLSAPVFADRIREAVDAYGVRVVILDHLHHLNYDGAESLRRGVDTAMRILKDVANETGVTIIASAQTRREASDKAQAYRVPAMTELAESGAIERMADIVGMVHRCVKPGTRDKVLAYQKGDPTVTERDFALPNRVGITLRKHRFGYPLGDTVMLALDWPTDRLSEVTASSMSAREPGED